MGTLLYVIYFVAVIALTIFYTAIISSHVKTVSFNGMQGFIDSWFSQLGCGFGLAIFTVLIGGGLLLELITSKIFWGIVGVVALIAIFGRDSSGEKDTHAEVKEESKSTPSAQSVSKLSETKTSPAAKFCKKCGTKINSGEKFCAKCGTKTD